MSRMARADSFGACCTEPLLSYESGIGLFCLTRSKSAGMEQETGTLKLK